MEINWPWKKTEERDVVFFVPIRGFGMVETDGLDGKPRVTHEQLSKIREKLGSKTINPTKLPDGRYLLN